MQYLHITLTTIATVHTGKSVQQITKFVTSVLGPQYEPGHISSFSLSLSCACTHAHSYLCTNHDQLHISCDVFNFCNFNTLLKDILIIYIMSEMLLPFISKA